MLDCGLSYGLTIKKQPQEMNIQDYWHDIDSRLEYLLEHGFVKLPSIKDFDLDHVATDISNEMGSLTHLKSLGSQHKNFFEVHLSVDEYLTPRLHKIAKDCFRYKGDFLINIILQEKLSLETQKEMFRAHFDSHIYNGSTF